MVGTRDLNGYAPNQRPTGKVGGDPIPDRGVSHSAENGFMPDVAERGYTREGKIGSAAKSDPADPA